MGKNSQQVKKQQLKLSQIQMHFKYENIFF